jgi:hypothetical protein
MDEGAIEMGRSDGMESHARWNAGEEGETVK